MKNSAIIGIIIGILAIGGGMVIKGAPMSALANPAAIMIIIFGTIAAVLIAFPMEDLKKVPKLLSIIFKGKKFQPKDELITTLIEWSTLTRREGILALESRLDEIDNPFLIKGMQLVLDGNDTEVVRDILLVEVEAMEERHRSGALIFSQAGAYAPTLGVLGAVVGLIAALGSLSEIEKLGPMISAAFVATLLGIFTGYVLYHPMANRLKQVSKKEVELNLLIVEGVTSIQTGISSSALEQKLFALISPTERKKLEKAEE